MDIPRSLSNLVDYANSVNTSNSERVFTMTATAITPNDQIPLIIPTAFARYCLFGVNQSDDCRITAQLQPGVYQNEILPYRDNLHIEVVDRIGYSQVVRRYRAIPLNDSDTAMTANNTSMADLGSKDALNLSTVVFQLIDPGFAIMRNEPVSDHLLMTTLANALDYQLKKYGEKLTLTGADAWRGVDIEYPYDNDRIFKQIIIPSAIPLSQLATWMQLHDQFGFYSKGLGAYYRKGMWYIYPLLKIGRYENARKVANIYLLPENAFPTLKNTWFWEDKVLTILSTGAIASNSDGTDIEKQNSGSGKRVISSDAVMGETGSYYSKGQALTTREDSLSEYKTSERGSGEENIPFHSTPTNNLCKLLSESALKDGTMLSRTWHNSDVLQLVPGMPCRVFFMEKDKMMYREGTILSARGETQRDTQSIQPIFREHAALQMFISNQTKPAE